MRVKVWDPVVRILHWSLAMLFLANALFVEGGDLHEWIGYSVALIVFLRTIWGFVGSQYARFSNFPPDLGAATGQLTDLATARIRVHIGHTPLGALMIYNLLLSMLLIGVSGYLMTTDMFWGTQWTEDLHEVFVTWAEISVVCHIAAVIFESRRTKVSLPKAMITGVKEIPEG